jgi:hypothetical protein
VTRKRVDDNHALIVAALRSVGCTVQSMAAIGKGCPDLLVGYQGRNLILEVKDGAKRLSKRRLTSAEVRWRDAWQGQYAVVTNVDEALSLLRTGGGGGGEMKAHE